jgi:hypothetical protein
LQSAIREIIKLREDSQANALKLAAIKNSQGYQLLQTCRNLRAQILPPESKRERCSAAIYRALRWLTRGMKTHRRQNAASLPSTNAAVEPIATAGTLAEKNLTFEDKLREENKTSVGIQNWDELNDFASDWHHGFERIRFAPLSWPVQDDLRADNRFIKLVILAVVPRAGSTLVQRLCNARKGTLVWGEHGGVLQHYADIYAGAAYFSAAAGQQRTAYFQQQEDPNLWIANMTPDLEYVRRATVESARTFLNTLYGQYRETHDMIGFKEVRYVRGEIELLRKCYPEAAILLLVRNPLNTWNSTPRHWYSSLDIWVSKWKRYTQCFLDFAANDPHCHLMRYEDITRQEKKTMELISDVAKITPEQIAAIMAHKLGSNHEGISDSERETIREHCRESMTTLGYLD